MTKMNTRETATPLKPSGDHYLQSPRSFRERIANSKWLGAFEIIAVFSPIILLIIVFQFFRFENPMILLAAVWVANVLMLGLIWLSIQLRGESWHSIGLNFKRPSFTDIGRAFLKSIPIFVFAVAAFVLGAIVMANIVGIPEGADMTKYNYLSGNLPLLLISLAGVYVVASFGEEVVYRGFLITRFQELFGGQTKIAVIAALLLSSVIFGFAHWEWGATGIVQTTFMGAAFGVSFLLTKRNLVPLIIAHGYMDTILFVQLYLTP